MKLLVFAFLAFASVFVTQLEEKAASKDQVQKHTLFLNEMSIPRNLTKHEVANSMSDVPGTWTEIEYGGQTFWVGVASFGSGVPYRFIGVYALARNGTYHRCLLADSCAAGYLKAKVNRENGLLELREHANSELKGQVILSCNLKSVGTYESTTNIK